MPNTCFNTLRIIGPADDLLDMLQHRLDFQHYMPCDEDIVARSVAWGTKWEHDNFEVVAAHENDMTVRFITAWSPPIPFLRHLNDTRFPKCWFKLDWSEEMAIGSGVWIRWISPKGGNPVEKSLQWEEPPNYPISTGEILLPDA